MPPLTTPTPAARQSSAQQPVGEDPGAGEGALLPLAEGRLGCELERHGLGRDDVLQRAALLAGEHRGVELLGQLGGGQDDAAAGAAERLVRGGGDDVGVRHRATGCRPAATRPAKCAMSTIR